MDNEKLYNQHGILDGKRRESNRTLDSEMKINKMENEIGSNSIELEIKCRVIVMFMNEDEDEDIL